MYFICIVKKVSVTLYEEVKTKRNSYEAKRYRAVAPAIPLAKIRISHPNKTNNRQARSKRERLSAKHEKHHLKGEQKKEGTGTPAQSCSRVVLCGRSDLGSLDDAHLCDPGHTRLDLADGAQLVRRVAGDADVVCALEHELQIADLKDLGASLFGIAACGVEHAVDKRVGQVQDGLGMLV